MAHGLTSDEIEQLHSEAYQRSQQLCDSLWNPMGGRPTEEVLRHNPNAPRMRNFKFLFGTPGLCPWADLDSGATARGADLYQLVTYFIGGDRARAVLWVRDVMRLSPPPSPAFSHSAAFRPAQNTRMPSRAGNPRSAA